MSNLLECQETKASFSSSSQVFGVATYDSLFKWVLDIGEIQSSFFSACIPGLQVRSSERIDDHMNPLKELERVRHFLSQKKHLTVAQDLKKQKKGIEVLLHGESSRQGTKFLHGLLLHFEDMKKAFPKALYDGTMDFLCDLNTGEKALVEMQILPQDNWESRALAYVAASYSRQMRQGMQWGDIRTVIGINLLGGGLHDEKHWKNTPDQYMRHYKLQEQINDERPPRFLDNIQLIQYSLANVPLDSIPLERREWLTFFRSSHTMTERDVEQTIKTPAVLAAFERAKLKNLPDKVMKHYKEEESQLKNLTGHMAKIREEGKDEGVKVGEQQSEREQIKKRLARGHPLKEIAEDTGWSVQEIEALQKERASE